MITTEFAHNFAVGFIKVLFTHPIHIVVGETSQSFNVFDCIYRYA